MGWRGAGGNGAATTGVFFFFGGLLMILGGLGEFLLGNTFPFVGMSFVKTASPRCLPMVC